MAFRNPAAALVQVGLAPGRQVIIDPTSAGQITFPNNNGFTPATIGTNTGSGFEELRISGPINPISNPDIVYLHMSDLGPGNNPQVSLVADAPSLTEFNAVIVRHHGVELDRVFNGITHHMSVDGLVGVGGIMVGPAATPFDTQFMCQAGSEVRVTDGFGFANVVFPHAFPNGLVMVQLTYGDARNVAQNVIIGGDPNNTNKTQLAVRATVSNTGASATGLTFRLNWFAIGY